MCVWGDGRVGVTYMYMCKHRVTHLGSHLMSDLEKQDVLDARAQTSKAYQVSKFAHTYVDHS